MTDVSGIPNMGFGGGGYFGGIPNQQPAMSAAQIQASMGWYPGMGQSVLDQNFNNFGKQTDYYSGLGAAYGRQTGYYGDTLGLSPGQTTPAAQAAAPQQPAAPQHQAGSTWIDPTPGVGAGAGYYGNGFSPQAYLTTNPDVARYATEHGMDPNLFAEEHAMGSGVIETRSGAEPFGNPFTWGNQASGGVTNPFGQISQSQWYQGLGGDAFSAAGNSYEPLYQTPFNERLMGIDQTPDIDFDERWGDTPNVTGRPFQQQYEDLFNNLTAPQRQRSGELESYFERNPDVWQAAQQSGQGVLSFAATHLKDYGENEGREIFNPIQYLTENQDVKNAGMDAWTHYDRFGRDEGRNATWGNVFNPDSYLMNNKDVKDAGVDARTHYLKYGQYEGRQGGVVPGGDVFDADVYKRLNPDVAQAGADPLTHWQTYGRNEGRQGAGTVETDRDSVARTLLARNMLDQYSKAPTAAGQALTHPGAAANQPSSGTLSVPQGSIYQNPFGGYVPSTAPNSLGPGMSGQVPGYTAYPGFDPNPNVRYDYSTMGGGGA
jgi:hypothetical protein